MEASRVAGGVTPSTPPPLAKGAAPKVIGRPPAAQRPWRYHPELVTRAPEPDEELVYGEATPVTYGWDAADRKHAVWKRKEAVKALQAARERPLKRRRVRRILTLGLWGN